MWLEMRVSVASDKEETVNLDMENFHHQGFHMGVPGVEIILLLKEYQQAETIHRQNLPLMEGLGVDH